MGCCCNPAEGTWHEEGSSAGCEEGECYSTSSCIPAPGQPHPCAGVHVACCFQDGTCDDSPFFTASNCILAGGFPRCPSACFFPGICDSLPTPERACCIPLDDGSSDCIIATEEECNQIPDAEWLIDQLTCDFVSCGASPEGKRAMVQPYYRAGDKAYTTDLCETAVMGLTKRPEEHGGPLPGQMQNQWHPVTTHEVRAIWLSATDDPCKISYGVLAKDDDGFVYPQLCSRPTNDSSRERYNRGFVTKQMVPDPQDRVEQGFWHMRVGVEPPVWSELALLNNWQLCGTKN